MSDILIDKAALRWNEDGSLSVIDKSFAITDYKFPQGAEVMRFPDARAVLAALQRMALHADTAS